MFIKREDYQYLEGLCKSLSPSQQERLMTTLLGKDRGGSLAERVRIVGEEIYDSQGVEQKDWITRTMIKKAFKDAKQG
jgi:Trp operon repressor